jgi:hypothetical protein
MSVASTEESPPTNAAGLDTKSVMIFLEMEDPEDSPRERNPRRGMHLAWTSKNVLMSPRRGQAAVGGLWNNLQIPKEMHGTRRASRSLHICILDVSEERHSSRTFVHQRRCAGQKV